MTLQIKKLAVVPVLLSLFCYLFLAYLTPRDNTLQLFLFLGLLFGLYRWLLSFSFSFKEGVCLAIIFRLVFIIAYPRLSDDYFRFIWDGTLVSQGLNPFLHLPSYYLNQGILINGEFSQLLYSRLNSPDYFSVYPPVCQYIFGLTHHLGNTSILLNCVGLRVFILLAEIGTLFLLKNLLHRLNLPQERLWWYAFNPLIIIELSGNLHFEALLIFFLLGAIYFLLKGQEILSALLFGLAVSVKLIPLMLLPLILGYLGWWRFVKYTSIIGLIGVLLFLPFLSAAFIQNLFTSLNLYFQKFEFNASIYYIIRWIGFRISGYNEISKIGPLLSAITCASICCLGLYQKKGDIHSLLNTILLAFTLYLSMATIVHPWYITTLVAISSFTKWRFPLFWAGVSFLSYAAYGNTPFTENYWLLLIEYLIVFGIFILEVYRLKNKELVFF